MEVNRKGLDSGRLPERRFFKIVESELHKLDDETLLADIDLVCEYIVLRFLCTSPKMTGNTTMDDACEHLQEFVRDIYPFLVTFISVANSSSLVTEADA